MTNAKLVISVVRDHRHLTIVLAIVLALYLAFPLQLQSIEPYNYAAAIERYYKDSIGFSLAQGENLPDFGRYHPNHPLGHVLAGWAYDWLHIPAMAWMRFMNMTASLVGSLFFYLILLQLRFSRGLSATTVALFLSTYCGLFTIFSGEWHMPALALSLGGVWQAFTYVVEGRKRNLYAAALLMAFGASYHLGASYFMIPVGIVLLFVRPIHERWREILIAGLLIFIILLLVYFVIPFILFGFRSAEEFLRTFLIYKYLPITRYEGFVWLSVAARTLLQSVIFTPAGFKGTELYAGLLILIICLAFSRFYRAQIQRHLKAIILLMPGPWIALYVAFSARPDALLGWLFLLPFFILVAVKAIADLHRRAKTYLSFIPGCLLICNLVFALLPNSLQRRDNIFFFGLPPAAPTSVPVAFVENSPVFTDPEIWFAGSELGFRNQMHFFPCCGENNYFSRLKNWTRKNPGFVLVSDGNEFGLENLLRSEGLHYVRWIDRRAKWPLDLVPSTLYVQHIASPWNEKKLIIWVPENLVRY
ncbi:hypothetical protein [Turneriella parva]|uniref:Glycosyltransferase RgtA/B/C/D-like domain-containing protein n=1 Tax=Turneriella parva (strain ATCC BAA-1111 / DSM 21527 / NCTC 11395 / H) TaxID=869212 RepID=I4B4R0_TURPD|nr:hypothetical protein [Turneriella parva]AFM12267.1 hypothetical protein Turpa_1619 [Turneriella parva DSM 21527]